MFLPIAFNLAKNWLLLSACHSAANLKLLPSIHVVQLQMPSYFQVHDIQLQTSLINAKCILFSCRLVIVKYTFFICKPMFIVKCILLSLKLQVISRCECVLFNCKIWLLSTAYNEGANLWLLHIFQLQCCYGTFFYQTSSVKCET